MLKEIIMYTLICDGCGADSADDEGYAGWHFSFYAEEIADQMGWEVVEDKHYCTDCFEYDDEGEIKLKVN